MRVIVPPSIFKDPMSVQWARDVADVGRRVGQWTPVVREFPTVATNVDSLTVTAAGYVLIGSLCFCTLNVSFHVPVATSPAIGITVSLPFAPQSYPTYATSQEAIVCAYNIDNAGNVATNFARIAFMNTDYAIVTVMSTAGNWQWYRDAGLLNKSQIAGNFFYVIANSVQGSST